MSSRARERSFALLATGDELLFGASVDTNSGAIARQLAALGYVPRRIAVIGDDEDELVRQLLELARDCAVIIITGGLGPTLDDVTRQACARAAALPLVLDEAELDKIKELFARRNRPFAQSNERQAYFPRGAAVLPNDLGSAPGFAMPLGEALVFALPGPPREMLPMLAASVLPRITAAFPLSESFASCSFYLFGLPESSFADECGAWMVRDANPLVGVTAKDSVLAVTLRARADTHARASALLEARRADMRARFAPYIFSESQPELALVLVELLLERALSIATAESCTGGLLAEMLTRVPGVSAVFDRGFVTYSNAAKIELLGVAPELIERHGAVSQPVAEAMARGAAERAGTRIAVAVTGIAGPDGGTAEKPVGLVWFGVSIDGRVSSAERRYIVRGRDLIRRFAANTAFDLVRRQLLGLT